MKPERPLGLAHTMARTALLSLAAMSLAFSATCLADDTVAAGNPAAAAPPAAPEPDALAEPAPPDGAAPKVYRHGPVRHLTMAQSIDESVRRLTRGLDLDPGQQVRLRQILVEQHQQMMQLRSRGAGVSGDVTVATLAIYDQARARIRAVLNEEQLKKYPAAVPLEQTAPAQADLQHWMQIQESKRKQDGGPSQ